MAAVDRGATKKKRTTFGNRNKTDQNRKRKRVPLGSDRAKTKKEKTKKKNLTKTVKGDTDGKKGQTIVLKTSLSPTEQLEFFLGQFQSANGIKLSSLELDSIQETCMLGLPEELREDPLNLEKHMLSAFGSLSKEVLCEGKIVEGTMEPGSPAVITLSASAIRSLELLKALRSLTKECPAVKLFSKHMKVEDQVSLLKKRVNIACGTPSRIKKLCDMEALSLSRLEVLVLDMRTDVKGYSLFTLPQVRDEFWDLYKSFFHQRLTEGKLRICLHGPVPVVSGNKKA